MIQKLTDYISYKVVPRITGDIYAPNVFLCNSSFLNWYYLKKEMKNAAQNDISGVCLDIGSGNSPYKSLLNVTQYISVDKQEHSATSYKKNENEINADAKDLPFEANYADSVILNQVLEHIDDFDTVLSEIARVLKSGGKLIISVPFIYHIHAEPNDYFRFSEYGIQHIMKKHKFQVKRFHYLGYTGTTLVSILNAFLWQVFAKNIYLKLLRNTLLLPFLLGLFTCNNILGLLLDQIKMKKFSPNYLLICEKQ